MDFNFKTELENVKNSKKYRNIWEYYAEKFLKKIISEIKSSKKLMFEGSEVIRKISFSIYYNSKIDFVTATWYNKKDIEIGEILDDFSFKNKEDASEFFKAITEKLKNDGFHLIDLPEPENEKDFLKKFYIEI